MELNEILTQTLTLGGSDVFIIPGSRVTAKVQGSFVPVTENTVLPADTERLADQAYGLAGRTREALNHNNDDDFSFTVPRLSRFRCNVYRQRGSLAATIRVVPFGLPDAKQLLIPDAVMALTEKRNGMILVTGPAGSGKSTTLACMVDRINETRSGHIITVEDPIEYLHRHKKSLVSQREVPTDSATFAGALRSALRQAPDVILLGEMRDLETVRTALTAAETGHLLLSSLHTTGAANTVDRVLDMFPAEQQSQVRVQLSMVLRAVVSQRLVPDTTGGQVPVFEVMTATPAVQNLIREGRTHQIDNAIFGGNGMQSMDSELTRLYREKRITAETAVTYAINPEMMAKKLGV